MKKILKVIREKGIRYSVAIAFNRLVPSWLLRVRRFNVYEMESDVVKMARSATATVRWSSTNEETCEVEKFSGPVRNVVGVGAEEMRVCYAKAGDEIAGAFWMASSIFVESGLTIRYELTEDQAWLFSAFVAKSFRRQGIYTQILEFMLPHLHASGKSQVLLSVNPDNVASRIVHEKYARRQVGKVFAVRFLSFAFCRVSGEMTLNRSFTVNHWKKPIVIRFGST